MGDHHLIDTFVGLADTLAEDFDVSEFARLLATRCVDLPDVDAAGLALADTHGCLRVITSTTEQVRVLQTAQVLNEEGPCSEAFATGAPISQPDLASDAARRRWPRFAVAATDAGFFAVHALPMRLRSEVIGVLTLLRTQHDPIADTTLATAAAMATMATTGLLQARAIREQTILAEQLQTALHSRVVIEQTKGLLAERLGVDVNTAFRVLRTYARSHNLKLSDLASTIIAAGPSSHTLLDTPTPQAPRGGGHRREPQQH